MVPSRSRKTAGRRVAASARRHLRRAKPTNRGCFDRFGTHACHATVVYWTAPQETRAAVRPFLHHGAPRSDRSGAVRIRRTEDRDNRQAHSGSNVHRAGVVADKYLAAGEERGQISNRGFADQTNRRTFYGGSDRVGNLPLGCCSEKNDVRVGVRAKSVYEIGEAIRRPALRGTIRRACTNGNARDISASACG